MDRPGGLEALGMEIGQLGRVSGGLGALDEPLGHGVGERARVGVGGNNQQPLRNAELRGRDADAVGLPQRRYHPVNQRLNRWGGDRLNGLGDLPQYRMTELKRLVRHADGVARRA